MLKISHTIALVFLAVINLNLVKSSIIVAMATMEATWLLGMFQRILIFCLVYVKYIPVEVVI